MTRRTKLLALAFAFAIPSAYVVPRFGYPAYMRRTTNAELEQAASNFCACMLGTRGGEVSDALRSVGAALVVNPPSDPWPARCEKWATDARDAYRRAWKWSNLDELPSDEWASASFVTRMAEHWTRDPDPKVPIAPRGTFALTWEKLVRVLALPNTEFDPTLVLRIDQGKLSVKNVDAIVIHSDDRIEHVPSPALRHHRDWFVFDTDPGAKRWFFNGDAIVDEQGHTLGPWAAEVFWGHSYADGHVTAFVTDAERLGSSLRWDFSPAGKLTRTELSVSFSKSTTFVDDWVLWKDIPGNTATVMALDLSKGPTTKALSLGVVTKPVMRSARTYGACIGEMTFVDMDPSFALHAGGSASWSYVPREQPIHRSVTCDGNAATVTEWIPLTVERCTIDGCKLVSVPNIPIGAFDELAADEHHLFQLHIVQGVLGMSIHSLDKPGEVKRVAILDGMAAWTHHPWRVVGGRAIVFLGRWGKNEADGDWYAISIRPDGTVKVLGSD